ncbi:MAG: 5'-nucleotidase C-terminal domain-containing protein [Saprospiraceae bacterium]|nr:5'-nucleotidase C-terminal domain-containing protein [Saprospiraceae bacterium]
MADISTRTYRIEKASFPVDVTAAALIEPYKLQLDKTMIDVISINEEELVKGKPSSTLTNWFTDILLDETQNYYNGLIHFAIQNYGGIRVPFLAKGNVTVGSVYELMPFDNIMYIVVMKGDKILYSQGGDNMDMFKDAEITNTGIFIRI